MKIKSLTLRNIRSYADQTVEFPDGTILIHGDNGAGKTSLLMGIFGGLFLSKIRNDGTSDFDLDDLVRRGEDKGTVLLVFEIDGVEYTVTWDLYTTTTQNSATLDSPTFSEPITGIGDVREEIIELLGMDEDDFSSSVYVKQGEIDRLIQSNNRATMIDGLLGLDEFDDYIDRMKLARRGAGRVQKTNKHDREKAEEAVENYTYTESEYEAEIKSLSETIDGLDADISDLDGFIEDLKEHRRSIENDIENYEDFQQRRNDKVEQIEAAQVDREEEQTNVEDSEETIENARAEIEGIEDAINELDTSVEYDVTSKERAREAREAAQNEFTDATNELTNRENDLQHAREELARLQDQIDEASSKRDDLIENRENLETRLEEIESRRAEATDELDTLLTDRNERTAAFLPKVDGPDDVSDTQETKVETRVGELRQQRENRSNAKQEITTTRDHVEEDLEEAQTDLRDSKNELSSATAELEEVQAEISEGEEELATAEDEFESLVSNLASAGSELGLQVEAESLEKVRDATLPKEIDRVNDDLNEVGNKIAEHEADKRRFEEDIEEIRDLAEQDTCPKCGQQVEEAHIEEEVAELEADIQDTQQALSDAKGRKSSLESRKDALTSLRSDLLEAIHFRDETVSSKRDNLEGLRSEAADLQSHIEDLESIIDEAETRIEELETAIDEHEDRAAQLDEEIAEIDESIETGESLLSAFDAVAEQRDEVERLDEEIADIREDIDDLADEISEAESEIADLEDAIEDQEATVKKYEEALDAAAERVDDADTAREIVAEAVKKYEEIADQQTTIDQAQQAIKNSRERIEDLNQQIARLQNEKEEIEKKLGDKDLEQLRADLERVTERIQQRQATKEEYQEKVQEKRDERTRLNSDLAALRETKDEIALHERRERWAKEVHDELDSVIGVYENTKSDLREQYLAYINEYTNDIFNNVYRNSSYQQVFIEETFDDRSGRYQYDIQLLRDDGTTEDPANASGGERAIVNLALRAGIYKLISEIQGGNQSQLPPFILDEPTTFLDAGHVDQLEQMLDTIQGWNVPQIIVVSHDEALVHGADHECLVTIDEATNTSQVELNTAGAD